MKAAAAGGASEVDPTSVIPTARLAGRPLLLVLDVDGTLAPIALFPWLARVPDATRRVIASLATRPHVAVVLVSGRAAHDARRLVGVEHVWTIGNHGAEVIDPSGEIWVDPTVARYAEPMARVARVLEPLLEPLQGVVLENKSWTMSIHYRAADEAIVGRLRGTVEAVVARNGLRMTEGKKVLEIRPPVRVDKGTSVQRLASQLAASSDGASILCIGDDATDEDAFTLLRRQFANAVTVHVGDDPNSAAEFRLSTPDQVRALLERVARDIDAQP